MNKLPVLDDGYVTLLSSTIPNKKYKDVLDNFFQATPTESLRQACFLVMAIRCPIFVQLIFAQHGLTLISTRDNKLTTYRPNAGEIGGSDHANNKMIAEDIAATSEALTVNPNAYQADGCDKFISQIILPISTYSTFIVSGTLDKWQKFYTNQNVPAPIKSYAMVIEQVVRAEYNV